MDLSRLNDAERRVLGLLAEGHTAKSIAHAIGSTPAAVNERLREARRKTGVGSSRELARVLKAQENRDEQIGVGSRHRVTADISPGAADPRRPRTGVYAMIGLLAIAAAGAAALMTQQPAADAPADPLRNCRHFARAFGWTRPHEGRSAATAAAHGGLSRDAGYEERGFPEAEPKGDLQRSSLAGADQAIPVSTLLFTAGRGCKIKVGFQARH